MHALPAEEGWAWIETLVDRLGLSVSILDRYPHEISGGQARRIAILRALSLKPRILVADEPTAGLDVSVQGGLLNLLIDIQKELSLTWLLISHDLRVIRRVTSRVLVMYLGQVVEESDTEGLFSNARASLFDRAAFRRCIEWARSPGPADRPARRNPEPCQPASRGAASTRAVRSPRRNVALKCPGSGNWTQSAASAATTLIHCHSTKPCIHPNPRHGRQAHDLPFSSHQKSPVVCLGCDSRAAAGRCQRDICARKNQSDGACFPRARKHWIPSLGRVKWMATSSAASSRS